MSNEVDTAKESTKEIVFSLELAKQEVKLKDLAGELQTYTIQEMTGLERDKYLTQFNSKMRTTPDGRSMMTDFKNIQGLLLSFTVRDELTKTVDIKTIEGWPASVQKGLFLIAQKLNGLDSGAEESAKND